MKRLFVLAPLLLAACQSTGPENIDLPYDSVTATKPGAVLHQSSSDLGKGFYDVSKSIVNPADLWEGIGHFSFVYYGKTEICQCYPIDVVISPKGKYIAYYSHQDRQWEIYNTKSKKTSVIPDVAVGFPISAEWNEKNKTLSLSLSGYRDGEPTEVHQIALN